MSNEELVAAIQRGENPMEELWTQVERLVCWKASQVISALEGRGGVEFDDLYQSGYPAMVAAVDSYKPEQGAFSTWFMYHLKNAFAEATGYRTQRGRNEPLNNAFSLDAPMKDDGDSDNMMVVIADPAGTRALDAAENAIYRQQLHEAMEKALAAIPEKSRELLRLRHYQGLTLAEIGQMQGVSVERVRRMENAAVRQMRQSHIACHLRPFYHFDFYCGTGLGAFRHTGMSIQERYLLLEEENRERAAQRQRQRRRREEELAFQDTMASIDQTVQERVSNMTPEEKERLLRLYGYA